MHPQHDFIWVITDQMTKLTHFMLIKIKDSAKDYARLYLRELLKLY